MCDPSETDEIEEDKSVKQERYEVTGMTCSACSSRVEKCVSKIDGVENVSVNLLTNSMQVSYDENKVNEDIIVSEVEKAGYGAALANAGNEKRTGKGKKINKAEQEIHEMKIRLIWSVIFLIPMMYISMHHMFYEWFGIPVPGFIKAAFHGDENALAFSFSQFLLLLPIMYLNRKYFIVGFKNLFVHRSPNMDSLIALGASASVIYGVFAIFRIGLMLGCIANIILDPLLIFGIGFFSKMGMRGAALATGIGQLLTLIFYLFAYFLRPINVRISRKYLILDKHHDLKLYGIGIPAILNLALPSLLISFLNGLLAAYDQCYVVVVGIYYKLQTFLYLPANGIIQGMRPLVGFNYGAGEIKRVKKIYHLTLCMNGVIMLLGMIICFTASPYLIGMFTDNATTISAGSNALRIICCGFLISTVSITASGALEGLSKGGQSLIISLLRYILFIIPIAFGLCKAFGPQYVFHAFWITEILTAAIAALLMKSSLRLPGTQA